VTEKIYVDASQPASLHDGEAVTECPTLPEAVIAWQHLPEERQRTATIRTAKDVFTVEEIERLKRPLIHRNGAAHRIGMTALG
jgi:hypothetical protein